MTQNSTAFRAFIWIEMAALLFAIGCKSPFATRNPEPPESQQRTNWVQPTSAAEVLNNLRNALQERNLTNYLRCFGDLASPERPFTFFPAQRSQIRFPGIWNNWDIEHEQAYITNIFHSVPKDSILSLIFLGEGVENPLPDSTIFIKEYQLTVGHTRNPDQFPKIVRGRAEFRLGLNTQGYWVIFFWRDDNLQNDDCWSDLKAAFVQ